MLHTKFRENRPAGSEEDFEGFYHMRIGGHLGHVTRRFHIKFGFDWPSGFGEDL